MRIIDTRTLKELTTKAKASPRKRINLNYHSGDSDVLQRLLNALEPSTYVQPHKHENPDKREVFIILQGSIGIVIFDDAGNITDYTILNREKGVYGIEIPPKIYHGLICLEENTVLYEIKDGPYDPDNDKNFAPWAPKEGEEKAKTYLEELKMAVSLL